MSTPKNRAAAALQRAREWDRCYPGNDNVESIVNDLVGSLEDILPTLPEETSDSPDVLRDVALANDPRNPSSLTDAVRWLAAEIRTELRTPRGAVSYIVVEADSPAGLQVRVRALLDQGWECQGGPFTYGWSPGHGCIQAGPQRSDNFDGWVYMTFCQAMVLRQTL